MNRFLVIWDGKIEGDTHVEDHKSELDAFQRACELGDRRRDNVRLAVVTYRIETRSELVRVSP